MVYQKIETTTPNETIYSYPLQSGIFVRVEDNGTDSFRAKNCGTLAEARECAARHATMLALRLGKMTQEQGEGFVDFVFSYTRKNTGRKAVHILWGLAIVIATTCTIGGISIYQQWEKVTQPKPPKLALEDAFTGKDVVLVRPVNERRSGKALYYELVYALRNNGERPATNVRVRMQYIACFSDLIVQNLDLVGKKAVFGEQYTVTAKPAGVLSDRLVPIVHPGDAVTFCDVINVAPAQRLIVKEIKLKAKTMDGKKEAIVPTDPANATVYCGVQYEIRWNEEKTPLRGELTVCMKAPQAEKPSGIAVRTGSTSVKLVLGLPLDLEHLEGQVNSMGAQFVDTSGWSPNLVLCARMQERGLHGRPTAPECWETRLVFGMGPEPYGTETVPPFTVGEMTRYDRLVVDMTCSDKLWEELEKLKRLFLQLAVEDKVVIDKEWRRKNSASGGTEQQKKR